MLDWLNQHPEFTIAGFCLCFITAWYFGGHGIAKIGGWARLAKRFRATEPFIGKRSRFCSGMMRFAMGYKSCLTLGSDEHGLYMAVLFPFCFGHPPLYIPWKEVSPQPEHKDDKRFLSALTIAFILGNEEKVPLWLHRNRAKKLLMNRSETSIAR